MSQKKQPDTKNFKFKQNALNFIQSLSQKEWDRMDCWNKQSYLLAKDVIKYCQYSSKCETAYSSWIKALNTLADMHDSNYSSNIDDHY
jgi:hypothetical protein